MSSVEPSYWKRIGSSCVSKESAYLMLTSWDRACKQTCSSLVRLKKSPSGLMGERKRKRKGRREDAGRGRKKTERWREGDEMKLVFGIVGLLFRSHCVSWGRFEAWFPKLQIPIKINLLYHVSNLIFFPLLLLFPPSQTLCIDALLQLWLILLKLQPWLLFQLK